MLPGAGEKPFAFATASPASLVVRSVGKLTTALLAAAPGTVMRVRGPYGRGFSTSDDGAPLHVLVGGAAGLAPLPLHAICLRDAGVPVARICVLLGGRSAGYVTMLSEFRAAIVI